MIKTTATVMIPSFATCAPSTCSTEEIQALLFKLFTDKANGTSAIIPGVYFCNELEKPSLNSGAIAMM